jgi:alpha-tubulin suppressor-like RCC1 family protein
MGPTCVDEGTNVADGTSCGMGLFCASGVCEATCYIDGVFYMAGAPSPSNPCQICQPTANPIGWSNVADGTNCAPGQVCLRGMCVSGCYIGGSFFAPGSSDPVDACRNCLPSATTTDWANLPDGASCGPAGRICCSAACVDDQTDTDNCGGCGMKCSAACSAGACAVPISVSAGWTHACALFTGGSVLCWGDNSHGELGNGSETSSSTPVVVTGLTGATSVASGADFSCAVLSDGTVECWGMNFYGTLGNGTTTDSSTPVVVSGVSGVKSIAAGADFACAVLSGGTVECWGLNFYGQLGDASTVGPNQCNGWACSMAPVVVAGLPVTTAIAAGEDHVCALSSTGTVACWGNDDYGQLGNGMAVEDSPTPVAVVGLSGVTAVTAGNDFSCALTTGGSPSCWGDNEYGQLGNGSTVGALTPVPIKGIPTASAITAGGYFACVTLPSVAVQCWGTDTSGELGDGATTQSAIPVPVLSLSSPVVLAAGEDFSCALQQSGSVVCWGDNAFGQLGIGTATGPAQCGPDSCSPQPVSVAW